MSIRKGRSRREWMWWGAAAIALSVGVVALLSSLPQRVPTSIVLSQSPVQPHDVVNVSPRVAQLPSSRPVRLEIPAVSINIAVGTLGLQPDHQIMVPTSAHVVDWYVDGPTPGRVGSAVILGHADSYLGPGTFFNLKRLKAGNTIAVALADGTVTHFIVTRVMEFAKTSFPDRLVYGSHGFASLELVTCGGAFDHHTGHYESNIVVFSRLVRAVAPVKAVST
ncbi:MAG: putative secreted protein [Acidimicrobiaceae bacterium]|nr:putative secreted protein [Acidimicrobiaceae bacterium]